MYRTTLVALSLAAVFSTACGPPDGGGGPITGVNPDGTPKWVNRGSGAYDGEHGKAFYGVGIVTGIDNPALLRQTGDNRARGEIAKLFDTYIAAMMKDYQRSTTAGNFQASAEEQDVVSAQKTITEVTLRGVEIRDHWTNPQNGALYALAILDLNGITKNLGQAPGLNGRVRDYVRDNAQRAFEDLDRELGQRTERSDSPPPANPPPPADPPPVAEVAPPPVAAPPPPPRRTGKIRVGLQITGVKRSMIQTCFANRLINEGYALFESTSDVDVTVRGTLTYQKAGIINGSHMVKASAEVRVMNMESGGTNAAVAESIKVGRPTLNESIQLAVSRLCDRVVPRIVSQIRSGIRR